MAIAGTRGKLRLVANRLTSQMTMRYIRMSEGQGSPLRDATVRVGDRVLPPMRMKPQIEGAICGFFRWLPGECTQPSRQRITSGFFSGEYSRKGNDSRVQQVRSSHYRTAPAHLSLRLPQKDATACTQADNTSNATFDLELGLGRNT